MDDLHERLTAAVNARMEVARAVIAFEPYDATIGSAHSPALCDALAALLVAHDPATVIRHCERDLRVLDRHAPEERFAQPGIRWCSNCGGQTQWRDCVEITDLATAYSMEVGGA